MTRVVAVFAVLFSALQIGDPMAQIAREYVRLVLAMGEHDKDYVDAYYGPEDLKTRGRRREAVARRHRQERRRRSPSG